MLKINFTDEQLDFINEVKKEVGQQYVWHLLEYERVCRALKHCPSSEEMKQNSGETRDGKWQFIIGGLKESGYIIERTVEDEMEYTRIHDTCYLMAENYVARFFKQRTTDQQKEIAVQAVRSYMKTQLDATEDKFKQAVIDAQEAVVREIYSE